MTGPVSVQSEFHDLILQRDAVRAPLAQFVIGAEHLIQVTDHPLCGAVRQGFFQDADGQLVVFSRKTGSDARP